MHLCYEYSGIDFDKLMEMDIYEFRLILINAYYSKAINTDKGRKNLNKFSRISKKETEIDTKGLMSLMGIGGK